MKDYFTVEAVNDIRVKVFSKHVEFISEIPDEGVKISMSSGQKILTVDTIENVLNRMGVD